MMSHPNNITNGASLEDSHTNFFALADLCGIKWRRLAIGDSYLLSPDPFDDPVLVSYSKCLAADLLCVWRRVVTNRGLNTSIGGPPDQASRPGLNPSDPHSSGNQQQVVYSKELWIFWYGEEPDLSELVSNELSEVEQGSWENGLSYECRSLLFKALHNLIERCLLSRGFARFGRWFVQPLDPTANESETNGESASCNSSTNKSAYNSTTQLSFAFNFFVHGESTVCATVDVRQHQPIYQLTKNYLTAAQGSQNGLKVILSPYGIAGYVTGQTYKESDPLVQRLLNEWKKFYPVNQSAKDVQQLNKRQQQMHLTSPFHVDCLDDVSLSNSASNGAFPPVVEVVVAGNKMKYPACYTYLTSDSKRILSSETKNSSKSVKQSGSQGSTTLTPPHTPPDYLPDENECKTKTPVLSPRQPQLASPSYRIRSNSCQEININRHNLKESCPVTNQGAQATSPSEDTFSIIARWDFCDPCSKVNCNCYRCKPKKGLNQNNAKSTNSVTNLQGSSASGVNKKVDKNDKQHKNAKASTPFHKRGPTVDIPNELDMVVKSVDSIESTANATCAGIISAQSTTQQPKTPSVQAYKSPLGQASLASIQSNATTPGGTAIDSPRSVAPLMNSEGPASYGVLEGNLSSVSPSVVKEETIAQLEQNPAISDAHNVNKEKSHLEQLLSPYHSVSSVKGVSNGGNVAEDSPSVSGIGQWTPGGQCLSDVDSSAASVAQSSIVTKNGPSSSGSVANNVPQVYGVKRPLLPVNPLEECGEQQSNYLYDFTFTNNIFANWDLPPPKNRRIMNYSPESSENNCVKKENMVESANDSVHNKPKDPYEFSEFDEDCMAFKAANEDCNRVENNAIASNEVVSNNGIAQNTKDNSLKPNCDAEMSATSPQNPVVFTRNSDLVVSYRDLDQIFDTSSGEESNEETFQTPSIPSNANKTIASHLNTTSEEPSKTGTKANGTTVNSSSGILGVAELTRMFPTPPSLEHNTAPSPCNIFAGTDLTLIDDITAREKLDIYPSSPITLENAKDWSYVYKPMIQSHCIISSKYAPLPNIPSLPAVQLPPECSYKSSTSQYQQTNIKPQLQQQMQPQHQINQQPSGYFHHQPGTTGMQSLGNPNAHMHVHQMHSQRMPPHSHFAQGPPCPSLMGANGGVIGGRLMRPSNALRPMQPQMHFANTQQSYAAHYQGYMGGERHMQPNASCASHYPPVPYQFDPSMHQPPSAHMYPPYHPYHNSPHHGHSTPPLSGNNSNLPPLPSYDIASHQNPYLAPRNSLQETNSSMSGALEAHGLLVNLVLSDSMLNMFKDHNFESCAVCVCNTNIKGSDVGIYLPEMLLPSGSDELQYKCTCGFSAVCYRHRSAFAGLFYEDEIEITGVIYDPTEDRQKKPLSLVEHALKSEEQDAENKDASKSTNGLSDCDQLNTSLVDLLKTQCSTIFSSSSLLAKAALFESIKRSERNSCSFSVPVILNSMRVVSKKTFLTRSNALQRSDCCEIAFMALITGKQSMDGPPSKLMMQQYNTPERISLKASTLHEWPFSDGVVPSNNYQVIRLLRNLQPLLQEAVQKKPQGMWEVTYTVSGPLTWRQFHRLAGRGTEDQCEPQPIPSLLVGHDKDWVALSPFGLKYWEKLMLEPFSVTKDVAYIVVAPEESHVISQVKSYFRELSTTYEMLRLGKHCPISKVLIDGIMRVGKTTLKQLEKPVDEWFNQIGDGNVAQKLKLYLQACRQYVAPIIAAQPLDKLLFDTSVKQSDSVNTSQSNTNPQKAPGSSPIASESAASSHETKNSTEESGDSSNNAASNNQQTSQEAFEQDEDPNKQPAIVIYIVEPFTFGSMDEEMYRLSCLGLLRCYNYILKHVPEHLQNSINLQLVSLDAVLGMGKDFMGSKRQDQLKSLAISVFTQCRKMVSNQSVSKSLTGFGPAASLELFLKSKDPSLNMAKIYTPPYILAPIKDKQTELVEISGDIREKSQTLFCAYCLTEDQKSLIVTCCNDKGDLLESNLINIEVPNRTRRKKASVRKFGLHKLMEFILSVMAESLQPWRLIIGRLGRVGHGELREWAYLLTKKSLLRYSRHLKDKCRQCSFMAPYEMPCIFSACLISLEADTALRVFPDQFTPDDRFSNNSNNCQLSTPEDASCTHILVFPTSAQTQSSQGTFPIDALGPNEDDLLPFGDELDDGINDIFGWPESPPVSPGVGSPRGPGMSHPDSPAGRQTGFDGGGHHKNSSVIGGEMPDEPLQLLQQPLALGYYVSTAQTGPLPKWFWSSCPHLQDINPVFLKSALLIHTPSVQQNNDDLYSNTRSYHPLDSNLTTDVLRYVLEGYNSLSWISLDPSTHDRMSCLPIHIQILMQLYHTVQVLL
ncbi:Mediator of RNA polymerase II transcription subunit 13-like protein [Dinothrombium tinctorium]|uniref:Mediator of RNA polymerase II transcription subunit 13 n=1 Tax=Dinothrombium tinctorium TaxID=1965070 RepID=A0A3S3SNK6_9ACAR|nr:Mediator of RNA polymerase II transcription subunit 13-like protein [Dinothrombium tinctorium]